MDSGWLACARKLTIQFRTSEGHTDASHTGTYIYGHTNRYDIGGQSQVLNGQRHLQLILPLEANLHDKRVMVKGL